MGRAASGAVVIDRALANERRRAEAAEDIEKILAASGDPYPDLAGFISAPHVALDDD